MNRLDLVKGNTGHISGAMGLKALNARWGMAKASDFGSDIDVLNYALTLEYLEAEFYRQGNGAGLQSGRERTYLHAIQADEEYHVTFLTEVIKKLGGTPVAAPGVDFGSAFDSRKSYLTTSVTFENVGVGAYLGAAGFIKDKAILQAAAGIFGVEARHAAVVGTVLGLKGDGGVYYYGAFEEPLPKATVLEKVAPVLTGGPASTGSGAAATTL